MYRVLWYIVPPYAGGLRSAVGGLQTPLRFVLGGGSNPLRPLEAYGVAQPQSQTTRGFAPLRLALRLRWLLLTVCGLKVFAPTAPLSRFAPSWQAPTASLNRPQHTPPTRLFITEQCLFIDVYGKKSCIVDKFV